MSDVLKAKDKKEDALMIMKAYENWDMFFVPASMAISLLGEMLLVSADRDIDLSHTPPKEGFKLIKYPNSLRASLVQVSNEGWMAFNEAHTSMDQIRLLSSNVEGHIRHTVKLLLDGSVPEIEKVLPISLKKIDEIAVSCWELAHNTEAKFIKVMELTAEILEASTASKGHYENKQYETKIALQVATKQKEQSEEKQKVLAARLEKRAKQVEKAQEKLDSALRDIPSTGEILGLYIVNGVMECVKSAFSLISLFNPKTFDASGENIQRDPSRKEETTDENDYNSDNLRIIAIVKGMETLTREDTYMSKKVKESVDFLKVIFEKELQTLEGKFDTHSSVANMLKKAIEIMSKFNKYIQKGQKDEKEEKQLKTATEKLIQNVLAYEINMKKDNSLPLETSKTILSGQNDESLFDEINMNVRLKIEVSKLIFSEAQEKHDMAFADLQAETNRLHATILEMQSLDITKISFDEIRSALIKGIKALAEVRTVWSKLCVFFQTISNLIKISLHSSLTTFVDHSKVSSSIKVQGVSLSNVYKEILLEQAAEANRIVFVVQNISTAYVKISGQYLMEGITSLGLLIPLDPKKDEVEMKERRNNLHSFIQKAAEAFKSIAVENKRIFDEKLRNRKEVITNHVEAIMPLLPKEKLEEIQATVEKGFSESPFSLREEDYV